jgi:hypothetical protein
MQVSCETFSIFRVPFCTHTQFTMREINMSDNFLACAGADMSSYWPLKTRSGIKMLEKKEMFCSWIQQDGGDVETQFPDLRVLDQYYSMPLRVQKSIFRHMRLSASFVDRDVTVTGVEKLRIPITLLREKMRTARRFSVKTPHHPHTPSTHTTMFCSHIAHV